jgi:hypothetical protein
MKPFKFFQKEVKGTLDLYEGETRATASLNDGQRFVQEVINYHHPRTDINTDTPEGVMNRRRLYHTNPDLYDRLRHPNNEMEQYFNQRELRNLTELQRDLNDNPIRLFQTTTVTKVNPKWWMNVKMFFQNLLLYSDQVVGIAVIATTITFIVILVISKLLNAW